MLLFSDTVVAFCPDGLFYLQMFDQPVVTLALVFLLLAVISMILIIAEGLRLDENGWLALRISEMVVYLTFFGLSISVFLQRGILTLQLLLCLMTPIIPLVLALYKSFMQKLHPTIPAVRQPIIPIRPAGTGPQAVHETSPSAPPKSAVVGPSRTGARYYIPFPVPTVQEKKGL
jgi:hypothetical protein